MKRMATMALSRLLIGGTTIHTTAASTRRLCKVPTAASEQFRDVYNSLSIRPTISCEGMSREILMICKTDYQRWSSRRQLGAWDNRNDCN
jgi:hypothetical protein